MEIWRRNELLMYWLSFFTGLFMIWNGFIFLFYASVGLSLSQMGVLAAIVGITTIIFEIPSGVFADHFGRKQALLVGNLSALLVALFLFFGKSFFPLAMAALFSGVVYAFESGSREALLYDSLKHVHKEKRFKHFASKSQAISMYVGATALLIGGLLSTVNFRLLFAVGIIAGICRVIISCLFIEPKIEKSSSLLSRFGKGFLHVWKTKELLLLFMYYFVVGGTISGLYKFHQLYLKQVGFSLQFIGILFAAMFFLAGITGHKTEAIERFVSTKKLLLLQPLILGFIYITMGLFPTYISGFLVLAESFFVAGISFPLLITLSNHFVLSSQRATILSVGSFLRSSVIIVVSLLVGFGSETFGLPHIYFFLGVFLLLFGFIVYLKLMTFEKLSKLFIKKSKKQNKKEIKKN